MSLRSFVSRRLVRPADVLAVATPAAATGVQLRCQSQGSRGRVVHHIEGEMRDRHSAAGNYKKLNPDTMAHYVKAAIQNSRREIGLPEVDDWHAFAEEAYYIRTASGQLWVGKDDPRASRVMKRMKKLEEKPQQIARKDPGPDAAKQLEDHPHRRFFVSPQNLRDPLSIAEGMWKAGYIPEHDVKYTAANMKWVERPPVVSIMGHVDHGKTTLLDYLRKSNVAAGEAGGITQSIGAFTVKRDSGSITFVDTPGHAAFGEMRKAGANVTDLIILVVSVTDNVQPQTKEVIELAKESGVPLVVAINKIDRGTENLPNVMKSLREAGIVFEQDQGDVLMTPISAVTGEGVEDLLENVLLQASMCEVQTPARSRAEVNIIDCKIPSDVPQVAGIVRAGTLKLGMTLVSGTIWGTVTRIFDETGKKPLKTAPVTTPVIMEGFKTLPKPGNTMMQVSNSEHGEKFHILMRDVYKVEGNRESYLQQLHQDSQGMMYGRKPDHNNTQFFNNVPYTVTIKAGTFGQLQALMTLIHALPHIDGVHLQIIATEVGGLSTSDILRANRQTKGCVLVFGDVKDFNQMDMPSFIDVYRFNVVYHGINWLKERIVDCLPKIKVERVITSATVKEVFKASQSQGGNAGGMQIRQGKLRANAPFVRVLRPKKGQDPLIVYEGGIKELRRFKDIVPVVETGLECGVILNDGFAFREGDILQEVEFSEEERDVDLVFAEAEEAEAKARLEAQRRAQDEEAQQGGDAEPELNPDLSAGMA